MESKNKTLAQMNIFKEFWRQLELCDAEHLLTAEKQPAADETDLLKFLMYNLIWGKYYCEEGDWENAERHLKEAKDYAVKSQAASEEQSANNDLYAYVLCELGMYYRVMMDLPHALDKLKAACIVSSSEKISHLARLMYGGYYFIRTDGHPPEGDMDNYNRYLNYFIDHEIWYAVVWGLFVRLTLYVGLKDFDKAYSDYLQGTEIAEKHGFDNFRSSFAMALGVWYSQQNYFSKAVQLLTEAYEMSPGCFRKSKSLEFLAQVYFHYRNYDKAAEIQLKSLKIAQENNILHNIIVDSCCLGMMYEEYLPDLKKAQHYYKTGYDLAKRLEAAGIKPAGYSLFVVERYENFQAKYNTEDSSKVIAHECLKFAVNQDWQTIVSSFQNGLLAYHRARFGTGEVQLQFLRLNANTYFSIRRRLIKQGYRIPDLRNKDSLNQTHEFEPGLETYLNSISDLEWKAANARFKRDVLTFLYEFYGRNIARLSKKLDLSYSSVHTMLAKYDVETER